MPYRPEWPELFARESKILADVFAGTGAAIEHVGSTSVPGLGAKPVIDIMIGVDSLVRAEARVPALAGAGYEYVPEYQAQLPDRRYFRKPFQRPRTHHLHIVVLGTPFWQEHILFRDYLRDHPDVACQYFELKQTLAAECAINGTDYTESKSPFIAQVLARARAARSMIDGVV